MLSTSRQGERGSVPVAMAVLMLLTLLSLAVLSRSQNQLESAARGSDGAAAEAGAEQGIAEALALIDDGQRARFSGTGALPGGDYRYEAVPTGTQAFTIYSEATVAGVSRAIEADVGGRALYPYTLFVDDAARFDGNLGRVNGLVGTNGPITVVGSAPGDSVDLFGADAACSVCADTNEIQQVRELTSPSPTGDRFQACPTDGLFSGPVTGDGGVPIVCDLAAVPSGSVVFTGAIVVVDGPLVVHVLESVDVEIVDATINGGAPPTDFQLFLGGTRSRDGLTMTNARVDGVLYAPGRTSTADGVEINGSMTIGQLTVDRGASLSISPSSDVQSFEISGWQVSSWEPAVPR